MRVTKSSDSSVIFAATLYAECRGEPAEGQRWVAWVIKNRARHGRSIREVCLAPAQFECWNSGSIEITDYEDWEFCKQLANEVSAASYNQDPTGGCDHYNNANKEGFYFDQRYNLTRVRRIGDHSFYRP
jgi:spore germination cell wall hydrolase CwlJ-like protein